MQKFVIYGKMPGMNQYVDALSKNRFKGRKMKSEEEMRIGWAIRRAKLKPVDGPVFLKVTFYEDNKRRDKDNIVSFPMKCIFDALKETHIIPNDGWKWSQGYIPLWEIDTREPRIEVEVYRNPLVKIEIEEVE